MNFTDWVINYNLTDLAGVTAVTLGATSWLKSAFRVRRSWLLAAGAGIALGASVAGQIVMAGNLGGIDLEATVQVAFTAWVGAMGLHAGQRQVRDDWKARERMAME